MSGLILCRDKSVTHPYYVKELGLHLYTGEELCYFIYHNIPLINEDFLDESLFEFLNQLGEEKLTARAQRLKEQAGLFDVLYLLLQELHYFTAAELFSFRRQLEELSSASYCWRMKAKGDYLFECGQFYHAIRVYEHVLEQNDKELSDQEFVAKIWHNKGCCNARLEIFDEAMYCMDKAYQLSRRTELLEKMFVLSELGGGAIPKAAEDVITAAMLKQFRTNLEDHKKLALFTGKALEAASVRDLDAEKQEEAYRTLLARWKDDYRRNQG